MSERKKKEWPDAQMTAKMSDRKPEQGPGVCRTKVRPSPPLSSSRKNSSLSLAECDFFISAMRVRGTFLLRDGEKKAGRLFRSGVGGVLKEVTWEQGVQVTSVAGGPQSHSDQSRPKQGLQLELLTLSLA